MYANSHLRKKKKVILKLITHNLIHIHKIQFAKAQPHLHLQIQNTIHKYTSMLYIYTRVFMNCALHLRIFFVNANLVVYLQIIFCQYDLGYEL